MWGGGVFVDRLQDVADADPGALAGCVGGHLLGAKTARDFGPPDAVGGDVIVVFRGKVEARQDARRYSDRGEDDRENSRLKGISHAAPRVGFEAPLKGVQVWGQLQNTTLSA